MGRIPLHPVVVVLSLGVGLAAGQAARAAEPKLEITCVGPEGYLLRGGGAAVLLDSFFGEREVAADPAMRAAMDRMTSGKPPFDMGVNVALVSHPHNDHFDPTVAGTFLERHPEAAFVTIPDVHAELARGFPRYAAIKRQLIDVKWKSDRRVSVIVNGVRVDVIRLAHEASQFYPLDVAIHIVHINGLKVLHAADPELTPEPLAALHLENDAIDVALLPYSFLTMRDADRIFAEHVRAKNIIAMHLPASTIEAGKAEVLRQFPRATFLIEPLQSVRY